VKTFDLADVMRRVADLTESLPYVSINYGWSSYGTVGTAAAIHACDEDNWSAWVEALGGSVDAAAHVPFTQTYTQHRWVSGDAKLVCFYLTPNPAEQEVSG